MSDHVRAAELEVAAAMAQHQHAALQFSGGKDSLACLYLLRPYWDRLTVIWSNAGDPYPETVELMDRVRPLVRAFHEVTGSAALNSTMQAFPVDMLPVPASPFGRIVEPSEKTFTLHSRYDCCTVNFWAPMQNATQQLGIDVVFRGQRDSEAKRTPYSSGAVDNAGLQYIFPLQHWPADQVFQYLRDQSVEIPRQYAYGMASLDCLHCTGYLDESAGKLRYLRDFHSTAAIEYKRRLSLIQGEQQKQSRLVSIALGELEPIGSEGQGD